MLQRWHGARRWDTYTTATSCLFVFSVQILDKRWHGIRTSNPPGVMYDHGRKIVHGMDGFCRAFCDDSPFAYTDGSSVAHVCFLLRLFVFFFILSFPFLHATHKCVFCYLRTAEISHKASIAGSWCIIWQGILCYYCVNAISGALAKVNCFSRWHILDTKHTRLAKLLFFSFFLFFLKFLDHEFRPMPFVSW